MMQRVLGFLLDTEFPDDIVLEARNLAGEVLAPPDADEVGSWLNSVSKSQVPELSGTGSRFIEYDLPNAGNDFATVVPDIPVAGTYEVLVTWGLGANCFDAEYTVNHADGASPCYWSTRFRFPRPERIRTPGCRWANSFSQRGRTRAGDR
jgi:hypothetical protein